MSEEPTVWNREAILARIRDVLDPVEFQQLEERLAGEIEGAEAAWLADVVDAAATLPLPAPPDELSSRLRSMFVSRHPRRSVEAILVNDSRLEQQPVGVRGGGDDEGWTLSYAAEGTNMLVDVWPHDDGFDIEAQLMSSTSHASFSLRLDGPSTYEASSDRLGRASVDAVMPGTYELLVVRADHDVRASLVLAP